MAAAPGEPGAGPSALTPLISPAGFREYDARWLYEREIDLSGVRALGLGLGTLAHDRGIRPHIVTGHDFRSYSPAVKEALIGGLLDSGCTVYDIGLALSPTAYFAQFALDVPAVAMVTASHNPNGWTGVKMGLDRPFTLEPADMAALKAIVLTGAGRNRDGGRLVRVDGMRERYLSDLTSRAKLKGRPKVVVACGNGTAGVYAPRALEALGCEVVPLHCDLDHRFPHYNPNPEDLAMLDAVARAVAEAGADIGLAFDGDGDRCGVIDNEGVPIYADKMGVLLARAISGRYPNARFVADVKSTALFQTDPLLLANGAVTEYWKTGHSYIKRRTAETGAIAGFERSGHFFFRGPLGRGYDDGLVTAIAVCDLLDLAEGRSMAELYGELQVTWCSPTMSPHCADDSKYAVVAKITRHLEDLMSRGESFAGSRIVALLTVNGVRVSLADCGWGLVRASSNKPELVVVCESPVSETAMRRIFAGLEELLTGFPEVGEYNQKLS